MYVHMRVCVCACVRVCVCECVCVCMCVWERERERERKVSVCACVWVSEWRRGRWVSVCVWMKKRKVCVCEWRRGGCVCVCVCVCVWEEKKDEVGDRCQRVTGRRVEGVWMRKSSENKNMNEYSEQFRQASGGWRRAERDERMWIGQPPLFHVHMHVSSEEIQM